MIKEKYCDCFSISTGFIKVNVLPSDNYRITTEFKKFAQNMIISHSFNTHLKTHLFLTFMKIYHPKYHFPHIGIWYQ